TQAWSRQVQIDTRILHVRLSGLVRYHATARTIHAGSDRSPPGSIFRWCGRSANRSTWCRDIFNPQFASDVVMECQPVKRGAGTGRERANPNFAVVALLGPRSDRRCGRPGDSIPGLLSRQVRRTPDRHVVRGFGHRIARRWLRHGPISFATTWFSYWSEDAHHNSHNV